eukprot:CAMPEP_0116131100 /NCGR_PEP_ID=MMETSP0329-20121206/8827_1 /TAXON_ID=697910 /ORGANISM="Pseudo-nitzschia arenysensis, Strain B593" /LENGTH=766 /DNA_ID=CAMNT_0003625511 /DNA_START=55 /DNA_END=2355 /DNA_ORIENTATION=-
MLAAEFFEKTYRNDDHRSIVTPSESKSAKSSRRSSSNNNKNNSNRDGLKEFAVLVSEAYRQECSTNHHVCTSDAADKKSPTTVARHLSDRNSRNNPRANHKTSTAPTQNQTKDRSAEATKKTNIQQSQYQERQFQEKKSPPEYKTPVKDHRDRTNDHYCSSTETSPIGVVDEWVSIRGALSKEKKKKKSTVIPPTTIEVPVAGLLDIRDQVLIQERCEQEKILNRELKQKVFDLQNQISVLQKGKSSKINHYEDNSSNNDDDDSSNDGPNVSKDCSGILEELLTPISSSPSPPAVETLNPKKVTKQQSSNSKRNFKAQLEESKQVIQMLFKDLKISKQNESDLATKLKAANVALHKEKQRSRENTRIAMKSADDVRASLVSKLQYDHRKSSSRSSDNEEVELLKQELARAREECHRWKRKEQLARRSAEIRSKTLYQQDKENRKPTALRRQQVLESRKLTKNEAITGRRSPVDTSKQEKATPKPPQLMEDKPEMLSGVKNKNESRPTSSLSQCHTISQQMNSNPLEIAQKKREPRPTTSLSQCHAMSQPKSSNPEITEAKDKREPRPTSTLSQCHAVSQPKNSAHAVLNTKCEARPTSSLSQCHAISQQKNPKPSEEAKNSSTSEPLNGNQKQQSKLMGACSTSEDSVLPKRRLDFFSCVANDTETQGLLKSPKTTIKTFVAPPQDNKNDKKGNETLGELMMELKASKERLQTADEKLNRLVNKDGLLLDCKVVRKCDDPKFDGAIDVVNSSNDVIEVSHRSFAYV